MDTNLGAKAVGHLKLRRALSLQVSPEGLEKVNELPVFEFLGGNSGGYEFDRDVPATGSAGFLEEVRVLLKQLDKVGLGLILGSTLRSGARLRGEGDPALADNLFCGNGDLHAWNPLTKLYTRRPLER